MDNCNITHRGQSVEKATRAMIMLHGRGGTAQDILRLADEFDDDTLYFAAPQATNSSWYPYSFMEDESKNEPWLSSAVENVKKIIDVIAIHIPTDQIYILGFSQGACLALETTARHPAKYGGVIAFTGGLIGEKLVESKYRGNFEGTPIFIGTSDQDPHVPLSRVKESKELLKKMGADVTLKIYLGMGHTINADEIDWVRHLLG